MSNGQNISLHKILSPPDSQVSTRPPHHGKLLQRMDPIQPINQICIVGGVSKYTQKVSTKIQTSGERKSIQPHNWRTPTGSWKIVFGQWWHFPNSNWYGTLLRSSERVSLSGNPVDVVVVQASWEAARAIATDLVEGISETYIWTIWGKISK